jgi:hypothetical protein
VARNTDCLQGLPLAHSTDELVATERPRLRDHCDDLAHPLQRCMLPQSRELAGKGLVVFDEEYPWQTISIHLDLKIAA